MKILGIGNAIVDVISKVEESFISQNGLTKGPQEELYPYLLMRPKPLTQYGTTVSGNFYMMPKFLSTSQDGSQAFWTIEEVQSELMVQSPENLSSWLEFPKEAY